MAWENSIAEMLIDSGACFVYVAILRGYCKVGKIIGEQSKRNNGTGKIKRKPEKIGQI